MNDIEQLQKFIRQRNSWKLRDQSLTDLQLLRKEERNSWELLIVIAFWLNTTLFSSSTCEFVVGGVLLCCGMSLLIFVIWRARKVQAIFDQHAIQYAEDLIKHIERRNSEQRAQPK
ncbi:MAG: hypothetical protein NT105_19955 [Verrucomicrobia bacterium]|nr:hypothetical protein [Verrucomicrobiota bacterium]